MVKIQSPYRPFLSTAHRRPRFSIRISSAWLQISIFACFLSGVPIAHAQSGKAASYTRQHLLAMAAEMRAEPRKVGHASDAIERHLDRATILAVRTTSGRAELHPNSADEFFVVAGHGELVTGGTIVHPQGSAEVRGDSITGGVHALLKTGDVVYIPPQTPHQLLLHSASPFVYVLIKLPAN